ncbi:MAG: ATP-binding cassette domain-containing protein [Thermoguttaceae bacterium]
MGPHSILRVRGGQPISGGPSFDPADIQENFGDSPDELPFFAPNEATGPVIHAGTPRFPGGADFVLGPLSTNKKAASEVPFQVHAPETQTAWPETPILKHQTQMESRMVGQDTQFAEQSPRIAEYVPAEDRFAKQETKSFAHETPAEILVNHTRIKEDSSSYPEKPISEEFQQDETTSEDAYQDMYLSELSDIDPSEYHLLANGLTKTYTMGKVKVPVLKGASLAVREGEFLAIVGQSGSGKSTLLHLLGTLDTPDKGTIHFEGQRIDNLTSGQRDILRNRFIGMIFQFYHLLPELNTLENVLAPLMVRDSVWSYMSNRKKYIKAGEELLESVGLSHRLKHRPNELSGGEMQRAAIARALIAEPQLLLADEPTGNLDAKTAKEIIHLLRELNQKRKVTIVMVTHDLTVAEKADRMVRIVDGTVN